MVVLSSLERTPSPQPVDKDFYSEFGDKNTGILSTPEPSLHLSLTLHSMLSWPELYVGLFHGRLFPGGHSQPWSALSYPHSESRAGVGLLLLLTAPKASSGYSPNVISSCRKNGEL